MSRIKLFWNKILEKHCKGNFYKKKKKSNEALLTYLQYLRI